ncbi:MAG: guanylate kinase [Bacteroidetes bacterium]|nr:guanylate kinase [Bacteroidota bacterium]
MAKTFKKLVTITAPSGAGKSSITHYLLKHFPILDFSVSATTRPQRGTEKDGKDYYFLSLPDFLEKISSGLFLEYEMVYPGKYYGTLKSEIDRIWDAGKVPILDIDVKGAMKVREIFNDHALYVFIAPPSLDELKKRLIKRGTETLENVETRLEKANYELSFQNHFDKTIINKDLEKACKQTARMVKAFLEK